MCLGNQYKIKRFNVCLVSKFARTADNRGVGTAKMRGVFQRRCVEGALSSSRIPLEATRIAATRVGANKVAKLVDVSSIHDKRKVFARSAGHAYPVVSSMHCFEASESRATMIGFSGSTGQREVGRVFCVIKNVERGNIYNKI